MRWHVAGKASLSFVAAFLRATIGVAMKDISILLEEMKSTTSSSSSESAPNVSSSGPKKSEEAIFTSLQVIIKCLAGAAEVLGDETGEGESSKLLHTGRTEVVEALSPEDKKLFSGLRCEVLSVLSSLHDTLSSLSSTSAFYGLRNSADIQKKWMKVRSPLLILSLLLLLHTPLPPPLPSLSLPFIRPSSLWCVDACRTSRM